MSNCCSLQEEEEEDEEKARVLKMTYSTQKDLNCLP